MMKKALLPLFFISFCMISVFPEETSDPLTLLESINTIREAHHLEPLLPDPVLIATASAYGGECVQQGFLSHRDRDGGFAVNRVRRMGGTALKVAEVLGNGPGIEAVITEWMNSPSHRSIVLNDEWTHAGGAVLETEYGIAAVLLFQTRPFSRIEAVRTASGLQIELTGEGFKDGLPVLFSRGTIFEPYKFEPEKSGSRETTAVFKLSEEQIFYHILIGLKKDEELIFTDRIYIP